MQITYSQIPGIRVWSSLRRGQGQGEEGVMCGILLSTTEARRSDSLKTDSQGHRQQLENENNYLQIRTITRPSNIRSRNCQQSKILSLCLRFSSRGWGSMPWVQKPMTCNFCKKKHSHLNCSYFSVDIILQNAVESSLRVILSMHLSEITAVPILITCAAAILCSINIWHWS